MSASLGAFTFENYDIISTIFLVAFLFIGNIILLNLLIAILSNTYANMAERSDMIYGLTVFKDYIEKKFNKYFFYLICLPPPINSLNAIFIPFSFFMKDEKLNNFVVNICYFIGVLIPMFAFYLLGSIILILISYILMFYKIYIYIIEKNSVLRKKYKLILIASLLEWLVIGPLYLILVFLLNDCPLFF